MSGNDADQLRVEIDKIREIRLAYVEKLKALPLPACAVYIDYLIKLIEAERKLLETEELFYGGVML